MSLPPYLSIKKKGHSFNLQNHTFSQTYGAILPTSLTWIVLLTRGYSPWRPDAVISTIKNGFLLTLSFFDKGFHSLWFSWIFHIHLLIFIILEDSSRFLIISQIDFVSIIIFSFSLLYFCYPLPSLFLSKKILALVSKE